MYLPEVVRVLGGLGLLLCVPLEDQPEDQLLLEPNQLDPPKPYPGPGWWYLGP